MKPRPFDYARPETIDEALALLAEYGDDARVLAGGQTLIAMLNLRLLEPAILIDITRVAELGAIREIDGKIEVGAAVTQNKLMDWMPLREKLPLVAVALPFVGHFQTRNKGTVCGSIAHADPASELPLALAVLEGEVVLRSRGGKRVLPARQFQQGMLTTARSSDELISAVRFPVARGGTAFREVARRHGDFAIVAVAAIAEAGRVRLGVAGVADRPAVFGIDAHDATAISGSIEQLTQELQGYDDIHASARMRRDVLRRLAPLVVEEAIRCAA
jgi:2-furoyl-CoA dehydrogenase FAD binding subunit